MIDQAPEAYAVATDVSVEKSQSELRRILNRYGCERFATMDDANKATVLFEVNQRTIRFDLPMPLRSDFNTRPAPSHYRDQDPVPVKPEVAYKAWEQACRSKWRALLLAVKAKLEAVECGIMTFEEEFAMYMVLPNGKTFGSVAIPALKDQTKMPNMRTLLQLPEK